MQFIGHKSVVLGDIGTKYFMSESPQNVTQFELWLVQIEDKKFGIYWTEMKNATSFEAIICAFQNKTQVNILIEQWGRVQYWCMIRGHEWGQGQGHYIAQGHDLDEISSLS